MEKERRGRRPLPSPIRTCHGGGAATLAALLSFPLRPMKAHYFRGGGSGNLSNPKNTRITPKPFRCLNIIVQYINLYLSTISRLLFMSVISSGAPNKLRSPKHITHNTNRHRTLSVRTLRARELCRHDQDTSPVNNQ